MSADVAAFAVLTAFTSVILSRAAMVPFGFAIVKKSAPTFKIFRPNLLACGNTRTSFASLVTSTRRPETMSATEPFSALEISVRAVVLISCEPRFFVLTVREPDFAAVTWPTRWPSGPLRVSVPVAAAALSCFCNRLTSDFVRLCSIL